MPIFHEYADNNKKDGFYIRANVGGSTPVTLQVSAIATRIFKVLGYNDGDAVPPKLVWAMYDLDMLYTLTSINIESVTDDINASKIIDELDLENKLDEDELGRVVSYLEAYSGPNEERIKELREQLLENLSEKDILEWENKRNIWFHGHKNLPDTADQISSVLTSWCSEDLAERALKAFRLNKEFVAWSVRTFFSHPDLAEQPIIAIEDNEIVYELDPGGTINQLRIADARGHTRTVASTVHSTSGYDYWIRRVLSDGTVERAFIRNELVVKYESEGKRGSHTLFSYDLGEILPPKQSYFGSSEDRDIYANFLHDKFLNLSWGEIESRFKKWGSPVRPEEPNDSEKSNDNEYSNISEDVLDNIYNDENLHIVEVDRESNSGNLVAYKNSNQIVITTNIQAKPGEYLVIKAPNGLRSDTVVAKSIWLNEIPSENISQFIHSNL